LDKDPNKINWILETDKCMSLVTNISEKCWIKLNNIFKLKNT
jgi:hypothetical protein